MYERASRERSHNPYAAANDAASVGKRSLVEQESDREPAGSEYVWEDLTNDALEADAERANVSPELAARGAADDRASDPSSDEGSTRASDPSSDEGSSRASARASDPSSDEGSTQRANSDPSSDEGSTGTRAGNSADELDETPADAPAFDSVSPEAADPAGEQESLATALARDPEAGDASAARDAGDAAASAAPRSGRGSGRRGTRRSHDREAGMATTATTARASGGGTRKKPARNGGKRLKISDPFILADGPIWYAYGTGLTVFSSTNEGKSWKSRGRMLSVSKWARRWAPEVHKIAGKYVAYMTLARKKKQFTKIYAATSSHPVRGWSKPRPLASSKKWSNIDATFFHDKRTGKNYLVWKQDRRSGRGRRRIVMAQLDANGTRVVGQGKGKRRSTTLLVAGKGKHSKWERRPKPRKANWSVEAPTLEFHGGKYWLFYSGAGFERGGGYAVGVASSRNIRGPFRREPKPIVRGDRTAREPGHQSIVRVVIDGVEKWLLFFHARGRRGEARYLRKEEIRWVNGKPRVHDGTPR